MRSAALLDSLLDGERRERAHHRSHRLSSEVIRSRSVLLKCKPNEGEGEPLEDVSETKVGSTTTQAILNLVIATAGGIGMVTLPGVFSVVGYLEGILLLATSGVCAAISLALLNSACDARKEASSSYGALVAASLGRSGSYTLECLTLAYCFGQVVAYLGAIGGQLKSLSSLLPAQYSDLSSQWSIGIASLLMFPLSLLPEKSAMRFAGAVGTFCMVFIVATVVCGDGISAFKKGACSLSSEASPRAFSQSLSALLANAPIFLFSMNASVIYVPVRKEHKASGAGSAASSILIGSSLLSAGLFYLLCSATAYYAYCSEIPENVVDVWPNSWTPGVFAKVALSLELLVAGAGIYIPLGRASFWHLIRGPEVITPASFLMRALVSFALVLFGVIGSILLSGALTLPLAVTSALCVTAQMFVLPGLILYKVKVNKDQKALSIMPLAFALVGLLLGVLSLAALFGIV